MSEHQVTVIWQRSSDGFDCQQYNRAHRWLFGGGVEVPASAAPEFLGDADLVDPEAAYVASLSSCHMLTFLAIASRRRLVVDGYRDRATGWLAANSDGVMSMTRVVLRPRISWGSGCRVSSRQLGRMHELAHAECFIANSVKTEIVVESDQ